MNKKIKNIIMNLSINFTRFFYGVDEKKVLFESFTGKSYSDNPKAISETLHDMFPNVKISWVFNDPSEKKNVVPDYVSMVNRKDKKEYLKELATAGTYVNNFPFVRFSKGKKQYLIQTMHGDRGFKRIYLDSTFITEKFSVAESVKGFCDLGLVGSNYAKEHYFIAGFDFKGEILEKGTPRCDKLVNVNFDEVQIIRNKLGLESETGILLYAPTLRRESNKSKTRQEIQDIDITETLDTFQKRDNKKWVCLLRAHPNVIGLQGYDTDERIIDVSSYEDMADLLLVSDVLITDYSSSAGDFALLGRLIILYQSDRESYLKNDRTFCFDLDDSPFWVATTQKGISEYILNKTIGEIKNNCTEILEFYRTCETGKASKYVIDKIADVHGWGRDLTK